MNGNRASGPCPAWPGALLLILLAASPSLLHAQPAGSAPALRLDAAKRTQILDALLEQLRASYVEADTARMIGDRVSARAKAGDYDALVDPSAFADAVTKDLRHLNGDLHLSLRYDPAGSGPLPAGMGVRRIVGGPGGPGGPAAGAPGGPAMRIVRGPGAPGGSGSGPGAGGPGVPAPFARMARESNFGLSRIEILTGNVGYLEISGFHGAEGSEEAVANALRVLERTDAVIIDVRRNGGGSGIMSHLVFSHFLPAEPVETIRVKSRDAEMSRVQQSLAEVPGPRRPEVPLYVLTSRNTGSAAEEFSFVLKNLERATLVGDRTAGAGHMVAAFPLPDGFVAGVSITRVSDPRTGAEWEAVGVQPDHRVPAERALGAAHALALRAVAAKAEDPERRATLERVAEWAEARDRPGTVDAARLAGIAGVYEGDRRVEIVAGRPMLRRGETGMPDEMIPLADGRFAVGGATRIAFAPGSPSPGLQVDRADGTRGSYARVEARIKD